MPTYANGGTKADRCGFSSIHKINKAKTKTNRWIGAIVMQTPFEIDITMLFFINQITQKHGHWFVVVSRWQFFTVNWPKNSRAIVEKCARRAKRKKKLESNANEANERGRGHGNNRSNFNLLHTIQACLRIKERYRAQTQNCITHTE